MLLVHISLCLVLILQKAKNAQTNFSLTSINICECCLFSLYLLLLFPGQVLFKQPSTLIMLRNRSSRSKHTFERIGFRPSIGNKMRLKCWFNRIRWLKNEYMYYVPNLSCLNLTYSQGNQTRSHITFLKEDKKVEV